MPFGLSAREYQILLALGAGTQIKDIARDVFLSPSTVSTYKRRVMQKLGLKNNAHLVLFVASMEKEPQP